MAQILTCAKCQSSLGVPDDMLGKLVRCPNCSATFLAPQNAMPASADLTAIQSEPLPPPLVRRDELPPRDDRDDRDRWRNRPDDADDRDWRDDRDYEPRRRIDPGWLTVQSGLQSMFVGALIVSGTVVVCFFLLVIIGISHSGAGRRNDHTTGILAVGLICLGMLVAGGGGVTSLVGRFMCLAAPDARSRSFTAGHLIFLVIGGILFGILLIVFVGMVNSQNFAERRNMQIALSLLGSLDLLTFLVSAIFLNLFLRGVAQTFDNAILAGGCTAFLVFETFWLLGSTGLALLSLGLDPNNFAQEGARVAWVLGSIVIGGGGGLAYAIWSMILLRGCHNMIRHAQGYARRRY